MHMSLHVIYKKMDEWILVNETQWCGIRLPDIHRFSMGDISMYPMGDISILLKVIRYK